MPGRHALHEQKKKNPLLAGPPAGSRKSQLHEPPADVGESPLVLATVAFQTQNCAARVGLLLELGRQHLSSLCCTVRITTVALSEHCYGIYTI